MNIILCKAILYRALFIIIFVLPSLTYLQAQSKKVNVIELRNYLVKPGQLDNFIDFFETKLIDTFNSKGNLILGQFKVEGAPDNFLWIRGFENMKARAEGYQAFYESKFWQTNRNYPLANLINYDNVYVLQPLSLAKTGTDSKTSFDVDWFGKSKEVAVVDFYIAKEKRNELIEFVRNTYDSLMNTAGVKDISYWINQPNSESDAPTCLDKDLLVTISFYKNESEYNAIMQKINTGMEQETKFKMLGIVTTKTTWILHPTKKSFSTAK
jgi:hypothetical protein